MKEYTKNGNPFQGDFLLTDGKVANQYRYEDGIRVGSLLTFKQEEDQFDLIGSLNYREGQAYHGTELNYKNECCQLHRHQNGILQNITVDQYQPGGTNPGIIFRFTKNGFSTESFDYQKDKLVKNNQINYSDDEKTSAVAELFDDQKSTGKIIFINNKITKLNIDYDLSELNINASLDPTGNLLVVISGPQITLKFVPQFEFPNPLDYFYFKLTI